MPTFRSHTVRFYKAEPLAIHCISYSDVTEQLAVSRADNSIEIWTVRHLPSLQNRFPGGQDKSVEGLCWAGSRLFSCSLQGIVTEYNLVNMTEKKTYPVTSGPAWCLATDPNSSKIAVGTEEGYVCIFNILPDCLEHFKVLDKQEGRILCLSWHSSGDYLATGSIDTIRVWNTKTGHPICVMNPGRTEKRQETIVWSVLMLDDMTVVSGDSRGKTSFWNGNNGTLMDAIQSHKADVLTIGVNSNSTNIYTSGVDPTIVHFQVVRKSDGRLKWVKSIHRILNTHDVRSIVSVRDRVFIGGLDTYLTVSNYTGRTVSKIPSLAGPGPRSRVAVDAELLLLQYNNHLSLWKLGKTDHKTGMIGSVLPLTSKPVHLLQMKAKNEDSIVSSSVSNDGKWMAFSTMDDLVVYHLDMHPNGSIPHLTKIKGKPSFYENSQYLEFFKSRDSGDANEQYLLSVSTQGNVDVFTVDHSGVTRHLAISNQDLSLTSAIQHVSLANQTALLSDFNGCVIAVDLLTTNLISKLPSYKEAPITALSISPDGDNCVIVYSDQKIVECTVQKGKYTQFSNLLSSRIPYDWVNRTSTVKGVLYIPSRSDFVLMYDQEHLAVLDKERDLPEPNSKLFIADPSLSPEDFEEASSIGSPGSHVPVSGSNSTIRLLKKHSYLVGVHHLSDDLIVCVEVRPEDIANALPPSLQIKKFGSG